MKNAFLSILRHVLTLSGGAVLANNPSLSANTVETAAGAILGATGLLWGAYDEYKAERKAAGK
jgi:hypothetical protein